MSGVSLEPCWAIKKHWNNKFYYTVASCWLFLYDLYYDARIHEHHVFATKPRRYFKCGNYVRTLKVLGSTLEFLSYWETLTLELSRHWQARTLELFKVLESNCSVFLNAVGSTYLRILK